MHDWERRRHDHCSGPISGVRSSHGVSVGVLNIALGDPRSRRGEVERLRDVANPGPNEPSPSVQHATSAMEFLRVQAGPESYFYTRAHEGSRSGTTGVSLSNVADVLDNWADYVEAGMDDAPSFEAIAREEAATDLMEQVQILLDDPTIHPAAPVVLAGSALEEKLRAMATQANLEPAGRPGLDAHATALRSRDLISRQQKKDIDSWAGLRNAAAHGQFDDIDRSHAQLMVLGVNHFLQKTRRSG